MLFWRAYTPQGSRISPILFQVLMSDLNIHVRNGYLTNFADDTQLTTIEESEEKVKNTTKEEREEILPEKGKKSCNGFHYMGPKLWNFLPAHIRKTTIKNIFKDKVKDFIWEQIPSV